MKIDNSKIEVGIYKFKVDNTKIKVGIYKFKVDNSKIKVDNSRITSRKFQDYS